MDMLLEKKNAVIYGAGGAIGGAVARTFAREGARIFLAGHSIAPIEAVAQEISEAGGVAEVAQVDALDEQAVEKHLGEVVKKTGGLIFPSMPSGSDTFRARHSSRWRLRRSPCRSQTP